MNEINNRSFAVGSVNIPNRTALAPMAGVSDRTFRRLAKEQGAGLICTEMVSAKGLLYRNERTLEMLRLAPDEHPVSLQLFGSEPDIMAEAAQLAEAVGADIIDINMGCPVAKVVRNGEGSALLKNISLATKIIAAMAAAVSVPVTVKMRIGWDASPYDYVAAAKEFAAAGAAALTVHGRTKAQLYSGKANWEAIRNIVEAVTIPVWGNGDVTDGPSAARMLTTTGCAGVAIGRAAQGNPFVFNEINIYLEKGEMVPPPSARERLAMCRRHLHLLAEDKGESLAVREMRTHAAGYLKGMHGAAAMRRRLTSLNSLAEWDDALSEFTEEAEMNW